jgi:hypothetical protein
MGLGAICGAEVNRLAVLGLTIDWRAFTGCQNLGAKRLFFGSALDPEIAIHMSS